MNALKTNKFRVGDEVTFIEYECSSCWEKGFGLSVGDVVQIESIDAYSQTAVVISRTGKREKKEVKTATANRQPSTWLPFRSYIRIIYSPA